MRRALPPACLMALVLIPVMNPPTLAQQPKPRPAQLNARYAVVRLEADLSGLSDNQKKLLTHLIAAARLMDQAFWREAYGNPRPFLASINNQGLKRFARINYGPWDRLDGNRPFITAARPKPPGANFYPLDITKTEFEKHLAAHPADEQKFRSQYTFIRRNADGLLYSVTSRGKLPTNWTGPLRWLRTPDFEPTSPPAPRLSVQTITSRVTCCGWT